MQTTSPFANWCHSAAWRQLNTSHGWSLAHIRSSEGTNDCGAYLDMAVELGAGFQRPNNIS